MNTCECGNCARCRTCDHPSCDQMWTYYVGLAQFCDEHAANAIAAAADPMTTPDRHRLSEAERGLAALLTKHPYMATNWESADVCLCAAPVVETREQIKAEGLREAADALPGQGVRLWEVPLWLRERADRIEAKP